MNKHVLDKEISDLFEVKYLGPSNLSLYKKQIEIEGVIWGPNHRYILSIPTAKNGTVLNVFYLLDLGSGQSYISNQVQEKLLLNEELPLHIENTFDAMIANLLVFFSLAFSRCEYFFRQKTSTCDFFPHSTLNVLI